MRWKLFDTMRRFTLRGLAAIWGTSSSSALMRAHDSRSSRLRGNGGLGRFLEGLESFFGLRKLFWVCGCVGRFWEVFGVGWGVG